MIILIKSISINYTDSYYFKRLDDIISFYNYDSYCYFKFEIIMLFSFY